MASMDQVSTRALNIHLLLIAPTKLGKTDYVAQAAIDGWTILYIDADNGYTTLKDRLGNQPEVMKRVHYFDPEVQIDFMESFVDKTVFRYNETLRCELNQLNLKPDHKVVTMIPSRIPRNVIVSLDSWTSLSYSTLLQRANHLRLDLSDVDKWGREVYGNAGFRLTHIADTIQGAPFHMVIQAHPSTYEKKEKPAGMDGHTIVEKDMITKETLQIPQSCSNPHGESIGKFFNKIAWLQLDFRSNPEIDFSLQKGRIGGSKDGPKGDPRILTWTKLFGKPPVIDYPQANWLKYQTGAEFLEETKTSQAAAPKLSTVAKTLTVQSQNRAPQTPAPKG